ncbi:hypothetical protein OAN57_00920 [Candidatus Pelagibacter ubique]|nr:hypothetical protein [Candidatus Pelagibacter ubique]MDC0542997.1 hypothetical protein [Candidatus Pelagibacter ubique]
MNIELALLKFINYYTKHNRDDNGQKYSEEQANLIETFGYSFVENIHPKIFEKNITENKIKLKSKRVKSDFVKISLNPIQILHFKLLYNIAYIKHFYPAKISKFDFSEDLSELLDSEDKIIDLYNEIKQIGLN